MVCVRVNKGSADCSGQQSSTKSLQAKRHKSLCFSWPRRAIHESVRTTKPNKLTALLRA